MRLNRFNTDDIEVGTTGGNRRSGRRMGGRGGQMGCGTLVIVIIAALVFGVDPALLLGSGDMQQQQPQIASGGENEQEICTSNPYATETCDALGSLNQTWRTIFAQQNAKFKQPRLNFATERQFNTACGPANINMGPFYCPGDQSIYIDVGFYETMKNQMGAKGDFARYYVIAHEYGHHIQTITGVSSQIRSLQQRNPNQSNQLQVLMELQADCYAGVWAGKNRDLIEPGDMEEGLRAASAIGDDTLQRQAGRRVNPESFTHGSSDQRMQALRMGFDGDDRKCDRIVELN